MAGLETTLRRNETTVGPVAFGGRTISLVARTTALRVGNAWGAAHVRARPVHVEVLDGDGHREVIEVRDVERTLVTAIAVGGVVGAWVLRVIRNRRSF